MLPQDLEKLENSHFLSTGSSPPEKMIKVKNDNVILAHWKKCFYTTPSVFKEIPTDQKSALLMET